MFIPANGLNDVVIRIENSFEDGVPFKKIRFLVQVADAHIAVGHHFGRFSFGRFLPGDDPQQGGLSGAVLGHKGHFLPFADLQGDILKQDLLSVGLRHIF